MKMGIHELIDTMKIAYIYILSSKKNGTLYIGVTSDLLKRVYEHKHDFVDGFTSKYGVHDLVYFEQCVSMYAAITREKQLKKWNRAWKVELIEGFNSTWADLFDDLVTGSPRSRG